MSRLFGTDGVRGIANAELTPELAFRLGEAAGHFLGDHGRGRIVVGRDTRKSGEMLEAALVSGLLAGGADALLCGIVPTPAVSLLVREFEADGGVVISASHNAPVYNGIKFFSRDGFKLPDELEDEIEAFCLSERDGFGRADRGRHRPRRPARRRAASATSRTASAPIDVDLTGLTIAVDCGHGASGAATPEALRRLGAEVIAINTRLRRHGHQRRVRFDEPRADHRHGARAVEVDLGIAHDGDADRVLAVDETGAEVDGDAIMAICAAHRHGLGALPLDTVVSTVMCNLGFEIAMRDLGISVIKTKVGDRYVLEQMRTSGATLGGEQSGHIIFLDHNTTGDGLVTALQLAAVMKQTGKPALGAAPGHAPLPAGARQRPRRRQGASGDQRRDRRGDARCRGASWATRVACSCARRAPSRSYA